MDVDEAQEVEAGADASASLSIRSHGVLRVWPMPDRAGWRAAGEINLITRSAWEETLQQLTLRQERVCHLELSAVTFVDVHGVSVLAVTAQHLPAGRSIMLHRPPPTLPRVLDMFWPGLPAIEVVTR
jgi:ABC-type transporter Mla MlaB component